MALPCRFPNVQRSVGQVCGDRLDPASPTVSPIRPLKVRADSGQRDPKAGGDLLVQHASGGQLEDLPLSGTQRQGDHGGDGASTHGARGPWRS